MNENKKVTVNRVADYASFALHGAGYAGVLAAVSLFVASPVLSAVALGVTLAVKFGLTPWLMRSFANGLPEPERGERTTDVSAVPTERRRQEIDPEKYLQSSARFHKNPADRKALDDMIKDIREMLYEKTDPAKAISNHDKLNEAFNRSAAYSGALGLRQAPALHYLETDGFDWDYGSRNNKKGGALGRALLKEFNKHANAAAFSYDTDNVILSKPLVTHLEKNEINAVVGHELGHIAARHGMRRRLLSFLSAPASLTAGLFSLVTTFSSLKNFGLVIAGNLAGYGVTQGYIWLRGLDETDKKDRAEIARLRPIFQRAAVMGAGVMFAAPDLVIAQGLAFATGEANTLLGKSYSRRNEYQADRLAAELTRDPMALVTGLDKVRKYNITLEKGMEAPPVKERQGLAAIFSRIQELYRTHPTNERRRAALEKMALAMGAPAP